MALRLAGAQGGTFSSVSRRVPRYVMRKSNSAAPHPREQRAAFYPLTAAVRLYGPLANGLSHSFQQNTGKIEPLAATFSGLARYPEGVKTGYEARIIFTAPGPDARSGDADP